MRKIMLLICVAFAFICYAYPCFIIPFGTYDYTYKNESTQELETATLQFRFDGKVVDQEGVERFYKLDGTQLLISDDETFDEATDMVVKYKNIYQLHTMGESSVIAYRNVIGMYAIIGVGLVAILLIITIPSKRD